MTKKAKNKAEEKELLGANEGLSDIDESPDTSCDDSTEDIVDEESEKETLSDAEYDPHLIVVEELKQKIAATDETNRELQDKYLRLSAEFDNYRKRTLKEKMDLTKQANGDLLKDILSVVDDFERGMQTIEKSEDLVSLKTGVKLIYTKFIEFIRQNGVKEIEAKDKDFDIDYHEALTKIPAPSEEFKGKVVDVIEKGYMLNDKVLRYSKVVVGE